jgi:Zn-dependent protease
MFWLVGAVLGYNLGSLPDVAIWILALFISILGHEMGHAVVARAFGFHPWIVLYGMGGLTAYGPSQTYRAAHLTAGRSILISLAGPVAGFLLAAAAAGAIVLAGHGENLHFIGWRAMRPVVFGLGHQRLDQFVNDLFFVCLFWGLINLLPVFPLDGGQIARTLLVAAHPAGGYRASLVLSVLVAGGLAFIGAVQWHDLFFALLFGLLAYESLTLLKFGTGRGLW